MFPAEDDVAGVAGRRRGSLRLEAAEQHAVGRLRHLLLADDAPQDAASTAAIFANSSKRSRAIKKTKKGQNCSPHLKIYPGYPPSSSKSWRIPLISVRRTGVSVFVWMGTPVVLRALTVLKYAQILAYSIYRCAK